MKANGADLAPKVIDLLGGRTRTRTWDPLIKSQLLYQLSYAPEMPAAGARRGCVCSKASSHCPAKGRRRVSICAVCPEILSPFVAAPPLRGSGPQIGSRGPGSRFARPGHEVVDSRWSLSSRKWGRE